MVGHTQRELYQSWGSVDSQCCDNQEFRLEGSAQGVARGELANMTLFAMGHLFMARIFKKKIKKKQVYVRENNNTV